VEADEVLDDEPDDEEVLGVSTLFEVERESFR
jgi:hypothetical protein